MVCRLGDLVNTQLVQDFDHLAVDAFRAIVCRKTDDGEWELANQSFVWSL
ncbi:MAG: hypothetical protein ACJAUP_001832 [Cellvibrionaceae bacterium]